MTMVEVTDVNRGKVYVNPDMVQLVHAEGTGSVLVMKEIVVIVRESIQTVLSRLSDKIIKEYEDN